MRGAGCSQSIRVRERESLPTWLSTEEDSWAGTRTRDFSGMLAVGFQIVRELGQLPCRRPQRFRRMGPYHRHNFVVQVSHQLRRLFLQRLGDTRHRTIETRGSLFHLAVEFGHTHPAGSVESSRKRRDYQAPSLWWAGSQRSNWDPSHEPQSVIRAIILGKTR